MDEIYIFDLKLKTWKLESQTLPTPRSVCVSTKISVRIVLDDLKNQEYKSKFLKKFYFSKSILAWKRQFYCHLWRGN